MLPLYYEKGAHHKQINDYVTFIIKIPGHEKIFNCNIFVSTKVSLQLFPIKATVITAPNRSLSFVTY